jgi:hypothetical protein
MHRADADAGHRDADPTRRGIHDLRTHDLQTPFDASRTPSVRQRHVGRIRRRS